MLFRILKSKKLEQPKKPVEKVFTFNKIGTKSIPNRKKTKFNKDLNKQQLAEYMFLVPMDDWDKELRDSGHPLMDELPNLLCILTMKEAGMSEQTIEAMNPQLKCQDVFDEIFLGFEEAKEVESDIDVTTNYTTKQLKELYQKRLKELGVGDKIPYHFKCHDNLMCSCGTFDYREEQQKPVLTPGLYDPDFVISHSLGNFSQGFLPHWCGLWQEWAVMTICLMICAVFYFSDDGGAIGQPQLPVEAMKFAGLFNWYTGFTMNIAMANKSLLSNMTNSVKKTGLQKDSISVVYRLMQDNVLMIGKPPSGTSLNIQQNAGVDGLHQCTERSINAGISDLGLPKDCAIAINNLATFIMPRHGQIGLQVSKSEKTILEPQIVSEMIKTIISDYDRDPKAFSMDFSEIYNDVIAKGVVRRSKEGPSHSDYLREFNKRKVLNDQLDFARRNVLAIMDTDKLPRRQVALKKKSELALKAAGDRFGLEVLDAVHQPTILSLEQFCRNGLNFLDPYSSPDRQFSFHYPETDRSKIRERALAVYQPYAGNYTVKVGKNTWVVNPAEMQFAHEIQEQALDCSMSRTNNGVMVYRTNVIYEPLTVDPSGKYQIATPWININQKIGDFTTRETLRATVTAHFPDLKEKGLIFIRLVEFNFGLGRLDGKTVWGTDEYNRKGQLNTNQVKVVTECVRGAFDFPTYTTADSKAFLNKQFMSCELAGPKEDSIEYWVFDMCPCKLDTNCIPAFCASLKVCNPKMIMRIKDKRQKALSYTLKAGSSTVNTTTMGESNCAISQITVFNACVIETSTFWEDKIGQDLSDLDLIMLSTRLSVMNFGKKVPRSTSMSVIKIKLQFSILGEDYEDYTLREDATQTEREQYLAHFNDATYRFSIENTKDPRKNFVIGAEDATKIAGSCFSLLLKRTIGLAPTAPTI